ncbi:MAG: lytic murein transglycosylase [Mesorhizobium sp.]|nr:MAG: lytic murein transglycosylase [Mesorhizobium sp.]
MAFRGAPLCPAGHLPLKGGDRLSSLVSQISHIAKSAIRPKLLISPLEGEMPGRAEGGAVPPSFRITSPELR